MRLLIQFDDEALTDFRWALYDESSAGAMSCLSQLIF